LAKEGFFQFRRVTKWAEEKAHQHFIFKYIIASYQYFRVNTQIDLDLALYLADHGVLHFDIQNESFAVATPLIRHLILETCYQRKQSELKTINFAKDPTLWIPTILDHLDINILTQKEAQKKLGDKDFPSEYILQSELFAIIMHVLRSSYLSWSIISEAKTSSRADLFIQNHHRIVIELKSGQYYKSIEDLDPDLQQAARYGRNLKATTTILLNIAPWETSCLFKPTSCYQVENTWVHFINVSLTLKYGQDPTYRYSIQPAESVLSKPLDDE